MIYILVKWESMTSGHGQSDPVMTTIFPKYFLKRSDAEVKKDSLSGDWTVMGLLEHENE